MKTLIIEDDLTCCMVLEKILSPYGECRIAFNGKEGIDSFIAQHRQNKPYDLVCLDIMMPGMDGQETLRRIRAWERAKNILGHDGVKVIMTTALSDSGNVMASFREQCEAYIVKPIDRKKLLDEIRLLGLI